MTRNGDRTKATAAGDNRGATVTSLPHVSSHHPPVNTPDSESLRAVTQRGRLVLGPEAECLELETDRGRFELLGPYGTEAHEGDEVEIVGVPDPSSTSPHAPPALLIRQMRRLA